jgi:hypothetical protein
MRPTGQSAVQRMLALYEVMCAGRNEEDATFWRDSEYDSFICAQDGIFSGGRVR